MSNYDETLAGFVGRIDRLERMGKILVSASGKLKVTVVKWNGMHEVLCPALSLCARDYDLDSAMEALREDFNTLYRRYALAPDETLTRKAQKDKRLLIAAGKHNDPFEY